MLMSSMPIYMMTSPLLNRFVELFMRLLKKGMHFTGRLAIGSQKWCSRHLPFVKRIIFTNPLEDKINTTCWSENKLKLSMHLFVKSIGMALSVGVHWLEDFWLESTWMEFHKMSSIGLQTQISIFPWIFLKIYTTMNLPDKKLFRNWRISQR